MNDVITIVSGLPRSGTSLMMQILESGGMQIVTDYIRIADEDNPKGYYEFEKAKKVRNDSSWLKDMRGKVFKMVSMLLFDLPSVEKYKIIFMQRNMNEVLNSQRTMLNRLQKDTSPNDDEMRELFIIHLNKIYAWIKQQKNMDVLYIRYNELILNPYETVKSVDEFLFYNLDIEKMTRVIDRSLYRNRIKTSN